MSELIGNCRWVDVRGASDPRGTVRFIETGVDLDFSIRRAFWIYDVPAGQPRGHHAHRYARLLTTTIVGAADLLLDDGVTRQTVRLDQPNRAVLVEPWVWHELVDFAASTVLLVLASNNYAEDDYVRDYEQFRREVKERPR